jgi:acyl-CoA reductase-like NAD-dependent aldehyde dehydrogenase
LFPKYLDPSCFRVIQGGVETAQALLEHPYGHILFTGGTAVGKEVMKKASKFLTPVTLELGGRNAALVTAKANVNLAAKRIAWGRFVNAGQTCFAPNYAIVDEKVYDEFMSSIKDVRETIIQLDSPYTNEKR